MRKLLCALCLLILLPVCAASATGAELTITGPDTIYAMDFFAIDVCLTTKQVSGVAFTLSYDAEHISFMGLDTSLSQAWECQALPKRFIFTARSPGSDTLPSMEFRAKDVPVGTVLWVELTDVVLTVDKTEYRLDTIRWEHKVDRPVSADNCLSSLKISDAVLSPAFSPTQQNYTATVSYHIASVDVTATARDPYAQVSINSPALMPDGVTNVTVTVTAEDGTLRVYTISVTREEDPNRPPSSDCELADIVVSDFLLSPAFDPKLTDYVLWLPYEVTGVDITGIAGDDRATVKVEGNKGLKAGKDNPITITCTAEDGSVMVYTVIAKRAEPYVPETTIPLTEASSATEIVTAPEPTEPEVTANTEVEIPSWAYIVTTVAAVTGAAAVGIMVSERKK